MNNFIVTKHFLSLNKVKEEDKVKLDEFFAVNHYVPGAYDKQESFENLNKEIERLCGQCNRLFYLALPPSVYKPVTTHIQATCKASG